MSDKKNNEVMDDFIQLQKRNVFKVGLRDENGVEKKDENGNLVYLEFDLEDIELPLKYSKCEFLVRKAQQDLKFDFLVIDKKQDVKTKKMMLSKNEEAKIKAMNKYYKTMEEAMDLFLGKGGVQKIFGDTRYYSMYEDLGKMIEPILPKLQINMDQITNKIKNKYKPEEKDVLKNE